MNLSTPLVVLEDYSDTLCQYCCSEPRVKIRVLERSSETLLAKEVRE